VLEALLHRPPAPVLLDDRVRRRLALEQGEQLGQRVVTLAAAVVDQVQAYLSGPLVHLGQREDLGGVDDGRVQPGLDALV
jgi:hypothetical protein